jgi:hypothetical protein
MQLVEQLGPVNWTPVHDDGLEVFERLIGGDVVGGVLPDGRFDDAHRCGNGFQQACDLGRVLATWVVFIGDHNRDFAAQRVDRHSR